MVAGISSVDTLSELESMRDGVLDAELWMAILYRIADIVVYRKHFICRQYREGQLFLHVQ